MRHWRLWLYWSVIAVNVAGGGVSWWIAGHWTAMYLELLHKANHAAAVSDDSLRQAKAAFVRAQEAKRRYDAAVRGLCSASQKGEARL